MKFGQWKTLRGTWKFLPFRKWFQIVAALPFWRGRGTEPSQMGPLCAYFPSRSRKSRYLLSGIELRVIVTAWNLGFLSSLLSLQICFCTCIWHSFCLSSFWISTVELYRLLESHRITLVLLTIVLISSDCETIKCNGMTLKLATFPWKQAGHPCATLGYFLTLLLFFGLKNTLIAGIPWVQSMAIVHIVLWCKQL